MPRVERCLFWPLSHPSTLSSFEQPPSSLLSNRGFLATFTRRRRGKEQVRIGMGEGREEGRGLIVITSSSLFPPIPLLSLSPNLNPSLSSLVIPKPGRGGGDSGALAAARGERSLPKAATATTRWRWSPAAGRAHFRCQETNPDVTHAGAEDSPSAVPVPLPLRKGEQWIQF